MATEPESLQHVQRLLHAFTDQPLADAASTLFNGLGYASERTVATASVDDFCTLFDSEHHYLAHDKAMLSNWQSVHLLFQLTDEDLAGRRSLFDEDKVQPGLMRSYIFLAIELTPGDYARGKLASIARQINKVFPMPVLVLFKIGTRLSIAVINRRRHKRDETKDVLGKVTLIRDVDFASPHRGHLDILASFAMEALARQRSINNFDALHAAWEEVFNVELLNKRFYEEISNWYFWARHQVRLPNGFGEEEGAHRSISVIRLLTRLLFCWFLKEKDLIAERLFDQGTVADTLKSLKPEESDYYRAILQNLFFATLNQPMNVAGQTPQRKFAADGDFLKNRKEYGVKTLYRYRNLFAVPEDEALALFASVPFLNGGLFACLDREDESGRVQYVDGFSRNPKQQAFVPNTLFFSDWQTVDLSGDEDFGSHRKRNAKVRGLLHIFASYKFTITENTPVEQEIALDPELLGKVFENLLATYNPETQKTARNETGSFYTPRPIVNHMVDIALKGYLADALVAHADMSLGDATEGLDILFAYTEKEHAFTEPEVDTLIRAIGACTILDPACGSGAFPMGMLQKLVYVLGKLDPGNHKWKASQLANADRIEDAEARSAARAAIEQAFEDNALDYGRKLYLIEHCIYGADIQPIAIQIAKLRFFISLVCDQTTSNDAAANRGIRPLPNLETRFVAADSLISLSIRHSSLSLARSEKAQQLMHARDAVRQKYFYAQTRTHKEKLRTRDLNLRDQIMAELDALGFGSAAEREEEYRRINWNPYDLHQAADFFEPGTMFGADHGAGFDIVIGNPPYIQIQKCTAEQKRAWKAQNYATYAATGDVYCLFYERGMGLLKPDGHLAYITSNKWMRAAYGEELRAFFSRQTRVSSVMDFGMAQNFGAATTYTCILHAVNSEPADPIHACYVTDDVAAMQDPGAYFEAHAVERAGFGSATWVVISAERQRIKDEVEAQGVPLKDWDIQINRGVLTGYNKAFYLTDAERDELIAQDPASEELIVPLSRGRYVERYRTTWANVSDERWMIATFPSLGLQFNDLPKPIQRHLQAYRPQLEPKPRGWRPARSGERWPGRKSGSYKWFEIQDSIAYSGEFYKPKIIYPNMTKYLPFYLDMKDHFFINDKAFILNSESVSLFYLVAIFNSSLFRCAFRDNFPELMGNTYEVRKIFVDEIPIKYPTNTEKALFETLVPLVQAARAAELEDAGGSFALAGQFLTQVIDACVMEVYFSDDMAKYNLGITAAVRPLLARVEGLQQAELADAAVTFYQTANDSRHPVRNILLRMPAESPDLLAVIQREGAV